MLNRGPPRAAPPLPLESPRRDFPPRALGSAEGVKPAAPRYDDVAMPRDNALRVLEGARNLSPYLGERMRAARLLDRAVHTAVEDALAGAFVDSGDATTLALLDYPVSSDTTASSAVALNESKEQRRLRDEVVKLKALLAARLYARCSACP